MTNNTDVKKLATVAEFRQLVKRFRGTLHMFCSVAMPLNSDSFYPTSHCVEIKKPAVLRMLKDMEGFAKRTVEKGKAEPKICYSLSPNQRRDMLFFGYE